MLTNGDLIRIPQGTVIMDASINEPLPIQVAVQPRMGIVIDNKVKNDDLIKVLLDDEVYYIDKRVVQLVGDINVRKTF